MQPTVNGVYAKVVGAYQKLHEFHAAVGEFANSEVFGVDIDPNPNPVLVDVKIRFDPLPVGVSILIGEFAHNLRSALDHLAWQLVADSGGTPNDETSFPIALNILNKNGSPRRPVRILPSVAADVETFVQGIQPYLVAPNNPTTQPLGALARINNIDKHHELTILRSGALGCTYALYSPTGGVIRAGDFPPTVVDDGAVIATLPKSQIPPDVQMQVVGSIGISIDIDGNPIPVVRDGTGADGITQLAYAIVTGCIVPLIEKMTNL